MTGRSKKPLTFEGKLGLLVFVVGWVVAVASGGLGGLLATLCAVMGFYLLLNQYTVKVPLLRALLERAGGLQDG